MSEPISSEMTMLETSMPEKAMSAPATISASAAQEISNTQIEGLYSPHDQRTSEIIAPGQLYKGLRWQNSPDKKAATKSSDHDEEPKIDQCTKEAKEEVQPTVELEIEQTEEATQQMDEIVRSSTPRNGNYGLFNSKINLGNKDLGQRETKLSSRVSDPGPAGLYVFSYEKYLKYNSAPPGSAQPAYEPAAETSEAMPTGTPKPTSMELAEPVEPAEDSMADVSLDASSEYSQDEDASKDEAEEKPAPEDAILENAFSDDAVLDDGVLVITVLEDDNLDDGVLDDPRPGTTGDPSKENASVTHTDIDETVTDPDMTDTDIDEFDAAPSATPQDKGTQTSATSTPAASAAPSNTPSTMSVTTPSPTPRRKRKSEVDWLIDGEKHHNKMMDALREHEEKRRRD